MFGLSLLTLRPGEMGGSETYARGLVRGLAREGTLDYVCFLPPAGRSFVDGLHVEVVTEYGNPTGALARAAAIARAVLRPGAIARRFRGLDAIHYPLTIPLPAIRVPTAITLHDVLHLDRPDLWPRGQRLFRRFAYDRPARRARLVIVPSEFVRRRVHELLAIPRERIRAIHHGIDHDLFRPGSEPKEPMLLYPARGWTHKNHRRLFEAFSLLRDERPELRLVLTGGGHETLRLPAGVTSAGLVSAEQLASLYRRAAALVFPSLHEGFGLPALEAMACGCPVVAARATSLPETCGEAALFFDPESPHDIARAVAQALDGPEALVSRGLERAASFTWERAAREHEAAYRELVDA